ncbi:hypothetical protein K443DRAFT_116510 [Laccaria amethystina LaAM-08-1]|uniref:Unplaced genomic scaffold K443scaffold_636, whole genome shotgun sequence n=1 Tax=Laccaria amethystina LaAM-08-1 TaxID=1095629 RepID=A0A0C9X1V2_9AGAR|nr:hypothetical protein K443DRAFT_116510 [Laccaria amethystina LaAM-08-1]
MGRRRWTTDGQGTWLAGHLDAFIDSQLEKTTVKNFFPKVIKEWREAWPLPDPTQEELAAAKSPEDAIQKKRTKEDERVKAWFHNHTRGQTYGSGSRGLLKLQTAKPRVRLEWQVYQQLTYESKWKAIIDKEWSETVKKWEAENPDTKMVETRFTFMNTFLQEKYKEESEDVKEEVKKRRAELKEEVAGDDNDGDLEARNGAYQK